ncbi:hypothetical protein Pmani_003400 [Petrolisthes manimaculis]|uniref:Uncharacterized protein n=1 Tax=Petrolisthes manimaculis TaxID=1843537 RepID=A0AAE1QIM0_9EUCA|nr:hypothetical protein Pmani_003400 [Petrolisthes manimaculis]
MRALSFMWRTKKRKWNSEVLEWVRCVWQVEGGMENKGIIGKEGGMGNKGVIGKEGGMGNKGVIGKEGRKGQELQVMVKEERSKQCRVD